MTDLAIRHHLQDTALRSAVADAGWTTATGFRDVRDGPLLGGAEAVGDGDAEDTVVLVLVDHVAETDAERLVEAALRLAEQAPTLLVGPTVGALPALAEAAGVHPGSWTPRHEIRLRPEPGTDPRRLEDLLVTDRLLVPEKVAGDTDVLVTANVGFRDHPVATWNAHAGLGVLLVGGDPSVWADPEVLRLVRHLTLRAQARTDAADVRVGMIGYGAIGHEHALAVDAVPGLTLRAVSDLNPARLDLARAAAADLHGYADSQDLLADDDVDLVVVSTPPNTHADWARRALDAGKHVVLEKPMALTSAECDDVMDRADEADRLVVVYQNRRFDPDYLVLRRLARAGVLGELFHVESFVGGFGHPCNYWHSEAAVSGGAIFDWGSHFIDQLLDLMPGDVAHVTGANHKRRWHDVTNADHSRVTVHFADGREGSFIHSDLAAATKPKWLALGTEGAVRGDWRTEKVVSRTVVGTLHEDVLAPADSSAQLSLHAADGSVTSLTIPPAPAYPFHRELADHLLRGLPMTVRAEQSRQVVATMEAAERSAARGSTPVAMP